MRRPGRLFRFPGGVGGSTLLPAAGLCGIVGIGVRPTTPTLGVLVFILLRLRHRNHPFSLILLPMTGGLFIWGRHIIAMGVDK